MIFVPLSRLILAIAVSTGSMVKRHKVGQETTKYI